MHDSEDILNKNNVIRKRQIEIIHQGAGIGSVLLALMPILTSLLAKTIHCGKVFH